MISKQTVQVSSDGGYRLVLLILYHKITVVDVHGRLPGWFLVPARADLGEPIPRDSDSDPQFAPRKP